MDEITIDAAYLNLMVGLFLKEIEADEEDSPELREFADNLARFTTKHIADKDVTLVLSVRRSKEA